MDLDRGFARVGAAVPAAAPVQVPIALVVVPTQLGSVELVQVPGTAALGVHTAPEAHIGLVAGAQVAANHRLRAHRKRRKTWLRYHSGSRNGRIRSSTPPRSGSAEITKIRRRRGRAYPFRSKGNSISTQAKTADWGKVPLSAVLGSYSARLTPNGAVDHACSRRTPGVCGRRAQLSF